MWVIPEMWGSRCRWPASFQRRQSQTGRRATSLLLADLGHTHTRTHTCNHYLMQKWCCECNTSKNGRVTTLLFAPENSGSEGEGSYCFLARGDTDRVQNRPSLALWPRPSSPLVSTDWAHFMTIPPILSALQSSCFHFCGKAPPLFKFLSVFNWGAASSGCHCFKGAPAKESGQARAFYLLGRAHGCVHAQRHTSTSAHSRPTASPQSGLCLLFRQFFFPAGWKYLALMKHAFI